MRVRIVAPLAALLVLLLAVGVVGSIAAFGSEVDATAKHLTADWRSVDRATALNLKPDGTFAATGIGRCIGDIGVVLEGDEWPVDLAVPDGEGTWHVEPNESGHDHFLIMEFRIPRPLRMHWQVDHVSWRFRPTDVTLVSLNPPTSADGVVERCALRAG